ncbi:MAG: SulP family sulfate permease [Oleiphilaceae bacterium]|jgi:SulP family sulfate permease
MMLIILTKFKQGEVKMPRKNLFSLRFAHALRECFQEGYSRRDLASDILAGLTVGIIAIPLAMALSIAIGLPPQYGLYTAAIAGFLIPMTGGSRYSVSGPTAAFIVILLPIVQEFGLAGLLLASMGSGIILVLMGWARLGRYIEYIPEPVTLGFTGGIAIVIAILQLENFTGINLESASEGAVQNLIALFAVIDQAELPSLFVGGATLSLMILWPKLDTRIPAHLPALILGSLLALAFSPNNAIATVASTFSYLLPNGSVGWGIPSMLPEFSWPWDRSLSNESTFVMTWSIARELLAASFSIAMLGAIESLLCAVVLDGMSGKRHSSNSELVGQGIGNIITPLFGGITATAAIARSAANYKAGAKSPISAMTHALVIVAAILFASPMLGYVPMASMAALLLVVAWNMSEAHKSILLIKSAQSTEIAVFFTCLLLTVLFDMIIAIGVGVVMASLLFMKQMAEMTLVSNISKHHKLVPKVLPEGWVVFKVNGPLFFAAADRIFGQLKTETEGLKGVVLYLDGVSILDSGGQAALHKYLDYCKGKGIFVYLSDFQSQPMRSLAKANFVPDKVTCFNFSTLGDALKFLPKKRIL